MLNRNSLLSYFALFFLVTSCKEDPAVTPGNTLTAHAGADKQAELGTVITLDGNASSDSEKKPFDFSWAFVKKPAGSTAALTAATTATPAFTPDEEGAYEAELTVSNAKGAHKDRVLITVTAAAPLVLDANITVKTILKNRVSNPELPDYVVNKAILVNAELNIEPGVVIAFSRDTGFEINDNGGILIAKGEAAKKIRFIGREKTKGFWKGIVMRSSSNANELDYVEISHAGSKALTSTVKGSLGLFGGSKAQISVKNTLFAANEGFGLYAERGSVLRSFALNTFQDNSEAGIFLDADLVKVLDVNSVFTGGNGRNVVEIMQSELTSGSTNETVWPGFKDRTPYRLVGNVSVKGAWKLLPGTVLEMARDITLSVEGSGYLNAKGTKESGIVIRGVQSGQGYWRGLITYSNSPENAIEFVDVSGGGSTQLVSGKRANIAVSGNNTQMSIKNCTISNSGGYAVFVTYQAKVNADIESTNTFKDNQAGNFLKEK